MYPNILIIRQLGLRQWETVSQAMHLFTNDRCVTTADEIWLTEHPSVFTQGQAGKREHLLMPGNIPVMQSDRGGQVTYHGPGQQIMYVLIDLKRRKMGVRQLVTLLEQTIIETLAHFDVAANVRTNAPGVYVNDQKICSLGLRIRQGCSFHGLALNVRMDLAPFLGINPCGYPGLKMTQLSVFQPEITLSDVQPVMIDSLLAQLGIESVEYRDAQNLQGV